MPRWRRAGAGRSPRRGVLPPTPSEDSTGLEQRANSLASSGRYAAAVDVQRRLVEAREQSLGSEHPDTLAARGNLAYFTGAAGDAAGARDQFAALLPISERVLGAMRRARRYQAWHRAQCLLIDAIHPFQSFSEAFCFALAGLANRIQAGAG